MSALAPTADLLCACHEGLVLIAIGVVAFPRLCLSDSGGLRVTEIANREIRSAPTALLRDSARGYSLDYSNYNPSDYRSLIDQRSIGRFWVVQPTVAGPQVNGGKSAQAPPSALYDAASELMQADPAMIAQDG
jgi:hypothetical protein